VLEDLVARIEGGKRALAFSSGMAAIDCLMKLFGPGDTGLRMSFFADTLWGGY
jgi:cystathionine beta-lyase/cystathionine gamma-synthase